MTSSLLDEVKERLQRDFGSPRAEWEFLEPLLEASGLERTSILKWVFLHSPAYWDTRARTGLILLQENESEAWLIIKKLVASADPDDHGTALTIFELTGDPRGPKYAKKWLSENVHPATQSEAIVFLKEIFPDEAWERLQALAHHTDANIRKSAERLMSEWEKS